MVFPWDSRAVGDCTDGNTAAGVCAEEDAGVGKTSGAVRLFGDAANDHPEGLYIKPPRPESSFLFCTPALWDDVLAISQIGEFNGQGFVGGTISLYGRDDSGWHFWYELAAQAGVSSSALSAERLAIAEGDMVTLYRFAPAPEPTYQAPEPPCQHDGALLPSGTPCLSETEPTPICAFAGYNGCTHQGTQDFVIRTGKRTCSGTSSACDGPWVDGGEIASEVHCDQTWDIWCVCNYRCGIDVCEVYSGC